jgi:hypothetical protein
MQGIFRVIVQQACRRWHRGEAGMPAFQCGLIQEFGFSHAAPQKSSKMTVLALTQK